MVMAVSFVSFTQQVNTNDSMGRLRSNVLLSFAQFPRESPPSAFRDKIAGLKRMGRWVRGHSPLG